MRNHGFDQEKSKKNTFYDTACTVRHYTFAKHTLRKTLSLDCRLGLEVAV